MVFASIGSNAVDSNVLLGLLLLANVNPALTHFHQPPYWERAIQGLVILLAVVADGLKRGKKAA
jgi:rhamnose transport system permease protein